MEGRKRIEIVYASQTGVGQEVSELLEVVLQHHWRAYHATVHATDAAKMPIARLANANPDHDVFIFIVSTTGQGANPDSMKHMWSILTRKNIPNSAFAHLRFACFGLGDSSYVRFNFPSKRLTRRFQSLGAGEIIPRGDGDDQHPYGLYGTLIPWISQFSAVLFPSSAPITSLSL